MGSSLAEPQCTDDHLTIFLSTEYDATQCIAMIYKQDQIGLERSAN